MKQKETLKRLRERTGLTQRQIAQALQISDTYVSHWERGGAAPAAEVPGGDGGAAGGRREGAAAGGLGIEPDAGGETARAGCGGSAEGVKNPCTDRHRAGKGRNDSNNIESRKTV